MSQPIQLLPGLSIHFAADGAWLYFEGPQRKGGLHLGNLAESGHVAGPAILDWIKEKRQSGLWFDPREEAGS